LPVQADHRVSVEDLPRTMWGQVPTRPAVHRVADLAVLVSLSVAHLSSAGALQDQGPLELRRRAQDVQQKF